MTRWRSNPDVQQLRKNKGTETISDNQMIAAATRIDQLCEMNEPYRDPRLRRIAQTEGAWQRLRVDEPPLRGFRIIIEIVKSRRIIIWRMMLRRDDSTYDRAEAYYRETYPRRNRMRRH